MFMSDVWDTGLCSFNILVFASLQYENNCFLVPDKSQAETTDNF